MVNANPSFPEVLGYEALTTSDQKNRVWAGSPARMFRAPPSTVAQTIGSLKLSAAVNPLSRASIPTVIDVIPEGSEFVGLPNLAKLAPNSDNVNTGWTDDAGGSVNIFNSINEDTAQWPGPADVGDIRTLTPGAQYACGVDASLFNGGAAASGRIFGVNIGAILASDHGFRKLSVYLMIDGVLYQPSGGPTRDVHVYGEIYDFAFGEINPATSLPWTPSDIAQFDIQSDWGIRVHVAGAATSAHFPRVMALSLNVRYLNTENRVAVGTWRRPEDIGTARLITVTTDALRTMPAGTANWAKPGSGSFLYYWRQTASPSQYGSVVADDVQWNGSFTDLGADGQPPGIVYPFTASGVAPPPAGVMASQTIAHDQWGRPQEPFVGTSRAAYGLVLRTTAPADSVDSWPYRMDLADLVLFRSTTGITGQRFTPATTQTYVGLRLPIVPPATGSSTLTAKIFLTGGAQQGGDFTITADAVRAIAAGGGGVRYVTGFFPAGIPLTLATQYEIRLSVTGSDDWVVMAPDCSLGPTTGFGSTTDGAIINGTHTTTRDMSVNLIRQPSPPTALAGALTNVATTTYVAAQGVPTVQHVNVTWTVPASPMGANFYRYELERQEDAGAWRRVAHFYTAATAAWQDRRCPRRTAIGYRIRVVGKDGRISAWTTTVGTVTPTTNGLVVILTSEHEPTLEVVYFYEKESSYLVLSEEGKETIRIAGSNLSVVFSETEDRGVGWATTIWVNQAQLTGKGGTSVLAPLMALLRGAVPYVVVMDNQGSCFMGDVSVEEIPQRQPQHRYTAEIRVIPTHEVPVPVEVP